jgi:hypothetical protein
LRSDCLTCRFIRLLFHTHEAFEKAKPTPCIEANN